MAHAGIIPLALCMLASCGNGTPLSGDGEELQAATGAALRLISPAFSAGGEIPVTYSCDGKNISPALEWSASPPGTESLALVADDPDAPGATWVHWVAYDLPAALRRLPEGVPQGPEISGGGRQGRNDFGDLGYGGPCPPPGRAHHYHFKIYALSWKLQLRPGARKEDLLDAMRGHVLSEGELIGLFKR